MSGTITPPQDPSWLGGLLWGRPAAPSAPMAEGEYGPSAPAQPARMGLLDPANDRAAGLFAGLQNFGAQLVAAGRPGGGGWATGLAAGGQAFGQGMAQGRAQATQQRRQALTERVFGGTPAEQLSPSEQALRNAVPANLRDLGVLLDPAQLAQMAAQAGMNRVRPMTPEERQLHGLRDGSTAYINETTGMPHIVQQSDVMSPEALAQRIQLARIQQGGGPESFGQPTEVIGPNGQRQLVQFGNRGGQRPVQGNIAPAAPNTSLVPTPGYDAEGNPVALFPDGRGGFVRAQTPEGVTLAPQTREIRVGNEVVTVDRGGREISRRPIDSFSPARDAASGRVQGEQQGNEVAGAPQALRTAETMLQQIDATMNHRALSMGTGLTGAVANRIPGTATYDFGQRVEQLQGQAFLQAFESLKGGGQITETEGRKATQAIARLSTAQSAADFRTALGELRDIVIAGRDRAASRTGAPRAQTPPAGVAIPGAGVVADPPPAAGGWSIRPR